MTSEYPGGVATPRAPSRFNEFILSAVERLTKDRNRFGRGYDITRYFTQDLSYGPDHPRAIKAREPPYTMCVAAVTEVIIEALNIYCERAQDHTPFQKLPVESWQRGTLKDIRAHIFQYDEAHCHGTAHALQRFGIGQELTFSSLKPGDFVTINRTNGSGHTTVFLGYLGRDYEDLPNFSADVAGYKYFSSQGLKRKAPGGLGYRWAYFSPYCPNEVPGKTIKINDAVVEIKRDCNIIRTSDQTLLNTGCLLHPSSWNVHPPSDMVAGKNVDVELEPSEKWFNKFEGGTTDD